MLSWLIEYYWLGDRETLLVYFTNFPFILKVIYNEKNLVILKAFETNFSQHHRW
jgi:hypothetical protein